MTTSWKTTLFGLLTLIAAASSPPTNSNPICWRTSPPGSRPGLPPDDHRRRRHRHLRPRQRQTSEQVGASQPGASQTAGAFHFCCWRARWCYPCRSLQRLPAPAQRIAYNAVDAPSVTVHQVMIQWNDYVGQYHPSAAVELKIKAAYEKYQAAELLALDAAHFYASQVGSTNSISASLYSAQNQPGGSAGTGRSAQPAPFAWRQHLRTMDPATISLVLFGIQEAIEAEPVIATELQTLFAKGIPTEEDWAASRARTQESYAQLVPNSALTAGVAALPAAAPVLTVVDPPPMTEPANPPASAPTPAPAAVFTGQVVDPHA